MEEERVARLVVGHVAATMPDGTAVDERDMTIRQLGELMSDADGRDPALVAMALRVIVRHLTGDDPQPHATLV